MAVHRCAGKRRLCISSHQGPIWQLLAAAYASAGMLGPSISLMCQMHNNGCIAAIWAYDDPIFMDTSLYAPV
ncbi:hypothetical protein GQ54DRAFT_296070 [Martensiomyces pterosporus]|nr:hypothetical protein GQ54DRAFT_296070 [Martensiomyces pterosporus]